MFKLTSFNALKRSCVTPTSLTHSTLTSSTMVSAMIPTLTYGSNKLFYSTKQDSTTTLNIPNHILSLRQRKLHNKRNNPIGIIKHELETYFHREYNGLFEHEDNLSDRVTTLQNFCHLLVPSDCPTRLPTDTYYFDNNHVLRSHASAHQIELLKKGCKSFLVTGDCFRKDQIDSTHYPVFHQMEGVRLWHKTEMTQENVEKELKYTMEKMIRWLFPFREFRWAEDETRVGAEPAFQMDLKLDDGRWVEIISSGLIHKHILKKCELSDHVGWVFGLGLDRLAMPLFGIDDIRQFWSKDERFLAQYNDGKVKRFIPYAKSTQRAKNIAFWLNKDNINNNNNESNTQSFHENDFMEMVRHVAGDFVESVSLVDEFEHAKSQRVSKSYKITYKHNDRTFTNQELNKLQRNLRDNMEKGFGAEVLGY